MSIQTFEKILNKYVYDAVDTVIQIEGGEPFTHPHFRAFLDMLSWHRFKVVVDTNGTYLPEKFDYDVQLKVSINIHVLRYYSLKRIKALSYFKKLLFNVRYHNVWEMLYLRALTFSFRHQCNYHYFNKYGRAKSMDLPELSIKHIYRDWSCYASDGTFFGQDLIDRVEYEHTQD